MGQDAAIDRILVGLSSAFTVYGRVRYPKGGRFFSPTCEAGMLWVMEGEVEWQVGGRTALLRPGDVGLSQPQAVAQAYTWRTAGRHGYVNGQFDAEASAALARMGLPLHRSVPVAASGLDRLIDRLDRGGCPPALALAELRLALAAWLCDDPASAQAQPTWPLLADPVRRALEHLQAEWRGGYRRLSVAAWAAAAGVTPEHLARLFHGAFATSPLRMQRDLRGSMALHLLAQGLPLKAVGVLTGCTTSRDLQRLCRDVLGQSPGAVQRACRRGQRPADPLPRRYGPWATLLWPQTALAERLRSEAFARVPAPPRAAPA